MKPYNTVLQLNLQPLSRRPQLELQPDTLIQRLCIGTGSYGEKYQQIHLLQVPSAGFCSVLNSLPEM